METYRIYPNVKLGKDVEIGDFCIIGYPPKGKQPGELETVIGDGACIRSHSIIYAGTTIGSNFQSGHAAVIREDTVIGNNVSLGMNSVIEHHCVVGDNVRMQGQVGICEYSILEDGCWIGPRTVFTNVPHPLCPKAKECLKGPTIKKRAILGANVILLPAVVIGEYSLVGAGCVVRKDIPPKIVVMGNPPKKVGDIFNLSCPYDLIDKPYHEEDFPDASSSPQMWRMEDEREAL